MTRHLEVVEHAQLGDDLRMLENAAEAEADDLVGPAAIEHRVAEPDVAGGRRVMPEMQLSSVLLPAPLGPIKPTMRPGATVSETFCKACTPPKLTLRPRTEDPIPTRGLMPAAFFARLPGTG